jgi:hypothetical protein
VVVSSVYARTILAGRETFGWARIALVKTPTFLTVSPMVYIGTVGGTGPVWMYFPAVFYYLVSTLSPTHHFSKA